MGDSPEDRLRRLAVDHARELGLDQPLTGEDRAALEAMPNRGQPSGRAPLSVEELVRLADRDAREMAECRQRHAGRSGHPPRNGRRQPQTRALDRTPRAAPPPLDTTPQDQRKTQAAGGSVKCHVDAESLFQPMPLAALPAPLAVLADEAGQALGCDPAFVAVPALVATASAIGNARVVRIKRSWREPSILWGLVLGESGTLKTPAWRVAMTPLFAVQADRRAEWRKAMARFKEEELPQDQRPAFERVLVSDITLEKLAEALQDAPRGLLLTRDELSAWVGGFTRYRSGGTDLNSWLELYNAAPLEVARKTGAVTDVGVERAAVCVVGGVQPGIMGRVMTGEHFESGLVARFLLAWPTRRPKTWRDAELPSETESRYVRLIHGLLDLRMRQVSESRWVPREVELSPAARDAFVGFYTEWAREQADVGGELAACFSKLEGACARLALVHHVVERVDAGVDPDEPIAERSVTAAADLVHWFGREARRVYEALRESSESREARELVEWVRARGGRVKARDLLRRNTRTVRTADAAEAALDALAKAGLGRWEDRPAGPRGGHPTREFVLGSTLDTTSPAPQKPQAS